MSFIEENKILFEKLYGDDGEVHIFFAPGRVNIIGEHLDYNGGFVFPAAISLGIYGFHRYRDDELVRMRSCNIPGEITIDLKKNIVNDDRGRWENYPKGVIKYLINNNYPVRGGDILFASTLPEGAGLSSSAALEVLTAYMMITEKPVSDTDKINMAQLCKTVENEFVGVQCGIMDQIAVAIGKKDHAILLNSQSLEYEYIPLDLSSYKLIIMNSNKSRSLTDSKYNLRLAECRSALEWIQSGKAIRILVDAAADDFNNITNTVLKKRARHVVTENNRVHKSVTALKERNLSAFGRYMVESHRSLQYDYEVTGIELDSLVDAALNVNECIGARMTGAGFGGCAIALVQDKRFDLFTDSVGLEYKKATGLDASFYRIEIDDGVRKL